jgi:hypothetical protein
MRTVKNVLTHGLGLLIICLAPRCSEKEASSPYPKTVSIEYRITSPDLADLNFSYTNDTGGTTHESGALLPFTKKITRNVNYLDGTMVDTLVALGTIDVKILVDGVVVESETCTGTSTTIVMCQVNHIFM